MDLEAKRQQIIGMIERKSPFDENETRRILQKYFATVPRLVKICVKYGFDEMKILDIGAAYGQTLLYWGDDAEAVDVSTAMLRMPAALGKTTYVLNVEDGFGGVPEGSYDGIYSNNLFEHLVSPHLFLARLNALLKPNGLLALGHPVVPPFPFKQFWNLVGFNGWMEAEHVNFFTPQTAKLTIERGGFRVIRQHFSLFHQSDVLSSLALPFGVHCLSICKKIEGYRYELVRHPMFDPSWAAELARFHGITRDVH